MNDYSGRCTLSILVPVYNEAVTIAAALARVRAVDVRKQIVVVDDGSTDGTREILQRLDAEGVIDVLVHHERNRGKGAAVRTAIRHATGEIAVVQDADLEYDPFELPRLMEPILDGRADAVFGSRFMGGPARVLYFWHRVGNGALTLLSNMLTNINLSDMETCYKMARTDLLKSLPLTTDRFGIEPELTARLAQSGARIYEVPISYSGRTYEEGKKIGWRDGVAAIWHILRANVFRPTAPRYVSLPVGMPRAKATDPAGQPHDPSARNHRSPAPTTDHLAPEHAVPGGARMRASSTDADPGRPLEN